MTRIEAKHGRHCFRSKKLIKNSNKNLLCNHLTNLNKTCASNVPWMALYQKHFLYMVLSNFYYAHDDLLLVDTF